MDKYYYLIAQLPFLRFEEKAYISKESFLEEAKKWLSDKDFKEITKAGLDDLKSKGASFFLREYKKIELTLRKELASYRQKKENQPRGFDKNLLEGNPLEIEKKLLFWRWQKVDELAQDFSFSREAVLAYFIKLQILEKLSEFDKKKGTEKLDSLSEVEDGKIR